jgi:hypothetical protein
VVLCLSQDGACTDSFENFRENSLKGDLSNDITLNPPLFSLVNTFNRLFEKARARALDLSQNLWFRIEMILVQSLHSAIITSTN